MKQKCQCQETAVLKPEMSSWYHQTLELPFVEHQPGECKCTHELKQYIRKGKTLWLCSCCTVSGDKEV
jgi:hypothetical protein